MKVIQSGPGTEELRRAIRDLEQRQARVGFFEHSKYPDGTPAAYVATIQEFGYAEGNIPPRPFFRPATDGKAAHWAVLLGKGANAVMEGRLTVDNMLEQFGQSVAGAVQEAISAVNSPALSDATIAARQSRKKSPGVSTKPLVDTGYLISQVNNDVVNK